MFYYFEELADELTPTECLVFSLIHGIYYRRLQEGESRSFYASNDYIAKRLGLSKRTIGYTIKALSDKNYIKLDYKSLESNNTLRTITPRLIDLQLTLEHEENFARGGGKICNGGDVNFAGGDSKNCKGVLQNLQPINKYINKFKNNNLKENNKRKENVSFVVASNDPLPKKEPIEKWNNIAKRYGLRNINVITPTREQHLRKRIEEAGDEQTFWAIIEKAIAGSPFLRGKNERKWKANFDFFLQQSSFVKASEGVYSHNSIIGADTQPIIEATKPDDETEKTEKSDLIQTFINL